MAIKFAFKKNLYNRQIIKDSGVVSTSQYLSEYSRLSRLMNARITRLEKKFPNMDIGYERPEKLANLVDENGDIRSMGAFASELSNIYKFLNKKTTTVTGFRRQVERSIKSFNKMFDSDIINEDNIQDLYDFLEDYRNKYNVQKIPDSDRLLDTYAEAVRLNIDPQSLLKDIDYWKSHYNEMKSLDAMDSDEPVDSSEYAELLRSR